MSPYCVQIGFSSGQVKVNDGTALSVDGVSHSGQRSATAFANGQPQLTLVAHLEGGVADAGVREVAIAARGIHEC